MIKATLTDSTVVAESGNGKTGPITVTNRSIATCPSTCPFLDADKWEAAGCFGAGRMWHQVNSKADTVDVEITSTPLMRDRVLGDITVPTPGDDSIDWDYVGQIQAWADSDGQTVFGYTHTDVWETMRYDEWHAMFPSYVLNVSTHTPEQVREVVDLGWPAVISSDDLQHGDMIGDKRVVDCPQNTHDVQCDRCMLCAKPPASRRYVIRFKLHGSQVKKARAAVQRVWEQWM